MLTDDDLAGALAAGWGVEGEDQRRVRAAVGHALRFRTWWSLAEGRFPVESVSISAHESWISDQSPAMGVYVAGYYPHNYDFLAFAASMIGRSEQAITASEKLAEVVPEEMLRVPGMTFLQHHLTRHLQMKVRFGHWEEILEVPAPAEDLPHARGLWHYARGRALAARRDPEGARRALEALEALAGDPAVADLRMEFNTSGAVLGVAAEVLAGHVALAERDVPRAIEHLRRAAEREDELVYGEPPEWTVPVRQELGLVLLEAGRPEEAERVFRKDLDRFPDNGWSLSGLARSLRDQGRLEDAEAVEARLQEVWSTADVPVGTV